jgi:hypothetical protein
MATAEDAVMARLAQISTLTNLCPAANHFRENLPQSMDLSAQEALVFNLVSDSGIQDMQGSGDLAFMIFQLDAIGTDLGRAEAVMEAARLGLQGWSGALLGVTLFGFISGPKINAPRDPDAELLRVTRRFELWHSEAAPAL